VKVFVRILILFAWLALALRIEAQSISVPCEEPAATLRLLEAVPPIRDAAIPYDQRVGALRKLADGHPDDFFIQRAYQDSFRRFFHLADEYDRALEVYRKRSSDPLSRYYLARLLMMVDPAKSRATFEALMKENPRFVWPHLDFLEWDRLPGRRDVAQTTEHWNAFLAACPARLDGHPDTASVGGKDVLNRMASDFRKGVERRNTHLDWELLPEIWTVEEQAGASAETVQAHVRADLQRIADASLWATPVLAHVASEAARILGDDSFTAQLTQRVSREAPDSTLAYSLAEGEWSRQNPAPARDAGPDAVPAFQKKLQAAQSECARRWPNTPAGIHSEWTRVYLSPLNGATTVLSKEDLAVIDRMLQWATGSPDGMAMWPPIQTAVAQMYVAGRARLDRVPQLLDLGYTQVEKQEKYRMSQELIPAELRSRAVDNRKFTWERSRQIRADYLLATNRPADARALIELALTELQVAPPADPNPGRSALERREWLRRLGDADAQEGKVEEAL
jgi:hypothetical protein